MNSIPYVLILSVAWSALRACGINAPLASVIGAILVCLTLAAMIMEFYKSGDIGLSAFGSDTAFSVVQVIIGASTVTVLIHRGFGFSVPDAFVCIAILADAWFSPYNSFRTALRNWSAQTAAPSSPSET